MSDLLTLLSVLEVQRRTRQGLSNYIVILKFFNRILFVHLSCFQHYKRFRSFFAEQKPKFKNHTLLQLQ